MKKVMMLLNGCGFLDGNEINEVVLAKLAFEKRGFSVDSFAMDTPLFHTIDHLVQTETNENRNQLKEAARIVRGQIQNMLEADANWEKYDVLLIPGGFGTAKNFCNFAEAGVDMNVHHQIQRVVEKFYNSKKVLAGICIAPVIFAKQLGQDKVRVTLGDNPEIGDLIGKWGAQHVLCESSEICVDRNVISTPAYMNESAQLTEVWTGIEKMAEHAMKMVNDL